MRHNARRFAIVLVLLSGLWIDAASGQSVSTGEAISVSAKVADSAVPLNRILPFSITVEWQGSAERYHISSLENPSVSNFTIVSSSASNLVEYRDGGQYSVKKYEFGLKPVEMGMGYIESIILEYTEGDSSEKKRVMTQRLGVKIIEPVPEPEERGRWIYGVIGFIIAACSASVIYYLHWKKSRGESADLRPPEIPLEERISRQLKKTRDEVVDFREGLSHLTRLLTQYLTEKFDIPLSSMTGDDMVPCLTGKGVDEKEAGRIREIFEKSDHLKFSGQAVDRGTYEMIYADITAVVERLNEIGGKPPSGEPPDWE